MPLRQREELTKLRVLQYLNNPPFAGTGGASKPEIDSALYNVFPRRTDGTAGRDYRHQIYGLDRLLPTMKEAGLIERQEAPDPRDGTSKPYFITDKGRRYLEEARQRAMLLEPSQRQGWAEGISIDKQQAVADVVRRLPEFQGSGEERIQEVSRDLAEAIGLPAPQTARGDAERFGR